MMTPKTPHPTPMTNPPRVLMRIAVDFNTLDSEPVDLVKIAAPGTWQERELPPLKQGERVLLYDADGLSVEATIIHDEAGWWLAAPDAATWQDGPGASGAASTTGAVNSPTADQDQDSTTGS